MAREQGLRPLAVEDVEAGAGPGIYLEQMEFTIVIDHEVDAVEAGQAGLLHQRRQGRGNGAGDAGRQARGLDGAAEAEGMSRIGRRPLLAPAQELALAPIGEKQAGDRAARHPALVILAGSRGLRLAQRPDMPAPGTTHPFHEPTRGLGRWLITDVRMRQAQAIEHAEKIGRILDRPQPLRRVAPEAASSGNDLQEPGS